MASYNKRISDQSKVKFNPINRELEDSENSELDSRVDNLEENILGSKTATGNPITVTDAAPVNAVNLSMNLEPIQDLHGYDHPWVGGAGKNKLPLTLANLKTWNTEGTWSGNTYTSGGISFTCYTSDDDAVVRIHAEGTSGSIPGWLSLFKNGTLDIGHATILSGCPAGGGRLSYVLAGYLGNPNRWYEDNGNGIDIPQDIDLEQVYIDIKTGYAIPSGGIDFYPMIHLATETDSSFAPYSNICPISGRTEEVITQKDNPTNPTVTKTYTIQLGQEVYGGTLDVTRGKMVVDRGYIASYNGETLPSTWISDRDVYASSTTPTIGAQVVYELAEPFTIDLTPQQIKLLENTNTVYTDYEGDTITIEYRLNTPIGEVLGEIDDIYNKIDDIYNKIGSLDTRVTALEES